MSFIRIAQEAPPTPDMGGAAPTPDLGGMGGGMDLGLGAAPMAGGAPAAPAAAAGPTPPSKYPLDSVNAIIKDADISQKIMGGNDIGDVVDEIWMMYGGQEFAGSRPECVGERMPFKEASEDELEATLNERWKRLPVGETLTSLGIEKDDMFEAVQNYSFGFSKSKNQPAQGGGGGMGLASLKLDNMIKTALLLDQKGEYRKADEIFKYL